MNDYDEGPSIWKILGVGLLVLGIIAAISIGVWFFRVNTAGIKGDGDTVIMNQNAKNRVAAQSMLRDKYYGVIALDRNIDQLAATVRAHPNDRIAQQNLDGQIMACRTAVEDYNAESGKVLVEDWHDSETPNRINDEDSRTDCKENVK